jgi:hypothetical protein
MRRGFAAVYSIGLFERFNLCVYAQADGETSLPGWRAEKRTGSEDGRQARASPRSECLKAGLTECIGCGCLSLGR